MHSYYNLIKVCSIFLLVALPKVSVKAYPGPESTLKQRIAESNYVVVAYVISSEKDRYGDYLNELQVIQTLQGNIQTKKITVVTVPYTCPGPPVFYKGKIVVTYLNKVPREPLYYVPGIMKGLQM